MAVVGAFRGLHVVQSVCSGPLHKLSPPLGFSSLPLCQLQSFYSGEVGASACPQLLLHPFSYCCLPEACCVPCTSKTPDFTSKRGECCTFPSRALAFAQVTPSDWSAFLIGFWQKSCLKLASSGKPTLTSHPGPQAPSVDPEPRVPGPWVLGAGALRLIPRSAWPVCLCPLALPFIHVEFTSGNMQMSQVHLLMNLYKVDTPKGPPPGLRQDRSSP